MVSVTILIVMILMTNQLLSASRKTIRIAEDAIKANADARAVADTLRNDLAQLTKQGFLAITYLYDEGTKQSYPHLVFTAVGDYTSRLKTSVTAKAALIDYGVVAKTQQYLANGNETKNLNDPPLSPPVMWRRARLLNSGYGNMAVPQPADLVVNPNMTGTFDAASLMDMCNLDKDSLTQASMFNMIIALAGAETSTNAYGYPGYQDAPRMVLPPTNLTQVNNTWPFLVSDVLGLTIQWTDGSRDPATGGIRWFDSGDNDSFSGRDANSPFDPLWWKRDVAFQWNNPGFSVPEYNITACVPAGSYPGNVNQYAALWTFRKPDNWPKALRVELKVSMGVDSPPRTYEIVIELPN